MIDYFNCSVAHRANAEDDNSGAVGGLRKSIKICVNSEVYPYIEDIYEDLWNALRKAVRAFADAGCRYLQLNEVYLVLLSDPKYRKRSSSETKTTRSLGLSTDI